MINKLSYKSKKYSQFISLLSNCDVFPWSCSNIGPG